MGNNIEYKVRLWEKLQSIVIENEGRNTGSISVLSIVTCAGSLFVMLYGDRNGLFNVFYYTVPILVMLCLFVYTFNNRVSAITRGYIAGLEDIINEELGENIFIHNKGYKELYHIPYFNVNDIVAILYLSVVVVASFISFKKIFSVQLAPKFILILYFIGYLTFSLICVYELSTNGKIKRIARVYFHHMHKRNNLTFELKDIDDKVNIKEMMLEYEREIREEKTKGNIAKGKTVK